MLVSMNGWQSESVGSLGGLRKRNQRMGVLEFPAHSARQNGGREKTDGGGWRYLRLSDGGERYGQGGYGQAEPIQDSRCYEVGTRRWERC